MKEFILFKSFEKSSIFRSFTALAENNGESAPLSSTEITGELINLACEYGLKGNLWHAYLALLLATDENPYTLSSEMRDGAEGSLEDALIRDLGNIKSCFRYDLEEMGKNWGSHLHLILSDYKEPESHVPDLFGDRVSELAGRLYRCLNGREFLNELKSFYKKYGVGDFARFRAFTVNTTDPVQTGLDGVKNLKNASIDDIVGMDLQKKKLLDNTEAFMSGRKANNVLLFGDAGTGKSTLVKALINLYMDRGLRIIEIRKHQYSRLNDLIKKLSERNYKFIIYMDDLSFEDSETEYKNLKAVIEGGLEKKPDNVLIYATSNRRHLIHEGFSDRLDRSSTDDIHESDTVQEKLSLSARFGERIYFGRPSKKEFDHIVTELAKRRGIRVDEKTLLSEANKWELSHGGLSGRTAEQFIDYIEGVSEI